MTFMRPPPPEPASDASPSYGSTQNFRGEAVAADAQPQPVEQHPAEVEREDAVADGDQADAHRGGDVEGDRRRRLAVTMVTCGSGFSSVRPCMTPPKPSMAMTSRMP